MAASATLAADDASTEETKKPAADTATGTEEDLSLSTGGGLMDALMGKDAAEDFSEEHLAQVEAVKKESKKEIAKKFDIVIPQIIAGQDVDACVRHLGDKGAVNRLLAVH